MKILENKSNYTVLEGKSNTKALYSYETLVAVKSDVGCWIPDEKISRTTSKHINKFLNDYNDLDTVTKVSLENLERLTKSRS